MNPSTADLAEAVRGDGLGPGGDPAQQQERHAGRRPGERAGRRDVAVVADRLDRRGVRRAARLRPRRLLGRRTSRRCAASACNVVAGEVTQAVRDTTTDAGEVHEGDWIGLARPGSCSIADSIAARRQRLLATLITPEHELLTIIEGEGATPANTRRITEFLAEEYPHVAPEVHHGGQPLYPYYFGLE